MRFSALLAALTCFFCLPATAIAQSDPQFRGEYTDWRVFTRDTEAGRVCYALVRPSDSAPRSHEHGSVYFIVATWQSGSVQEQPNLLVGYDLRPSSPPRVQVGSNRYSMFVDNREGFLDDLEDEPRLVRSMRRGSVMRVEATSTEGTGTSYEFSLSGVTAALQRVDALCS
ncbi:invasion associated locus B family protein [Maricaulis sp.]|uniref:invasion associated locus B family protein n=1 Tax=Maricaulis sp. TaxID=1486257 RepID=UPI002629DB89|nr:invasion associated locus B family protein [Maricaulis sp.]